jgi:hypothetical protein
MMPHVALLNRQFDEALNWLRWQRSEIRENRQSTHCLPPVAFSRQISFASYESVCMFRLPTGGLRRGAGFFRRVAAVGWNPA